MTHYRLDCENKTNLGIIFPLLLGKHVARERLVFTIDQQFLGITFANIAYRSARDNGLILIVVFRYIISPC